MYGKTRFSSFAILIESLQKHHPTLDKAVKSQLFMTTARKAARQRVWSPPGDDLPKDLLKAERIMEEMEQGLFNSRAVPDALIDLKKYAVIYQDITSQRFWDALGVCSRASFRHPDGRVYTQHRLITIVSLGHACMCVTIQRCGVIETSFLGQSR